MNIIPHIKRQFGIKELVAEINTATGKSFTADYKSISNFGTYNTTTGISVFMLPQGKNGEETQNEIQIFPNEIAAFVNKKKGTSLNGIDIENVHKFDASEIEIITTK